MANSLRAVRYPNQVEGLVSATKRIDSLNDSRVIAPRCFLSKQSGLLFINDLEHRASTTETSRHGGEGKWRLGKGVNVSMRVISETSSGLRKAQQELRLCEAFDNDCQAALWYHGRRLPLDQKIRWNTV